MFLDLFGETEEDVSLGVRRGCVEQRLKNYLQKKLPQKRIKDSI